MIAELTEYKLESQYTYQKGRYLLEKQSLINNVWK